MSESYGALCNDFYVNQRLNLKMDLPSSRETILAMFDRVRREFPHMDRFRRFSNELALESDGPESPSGSPQQWLAMRRTSVRSGSVNPPAPKDAYKLHKLVLEIAPYFLSISPLDVDYVELLYGFDLLAAGNHDAIVFDALMAGPRASPLASLVDVRGAVPIDCQPLIGVSLNEACDLQAQFEVKTRTPTRAVKRGEFEAQPISVYLTLRKYGAVADVSELKDTFATLSKRGEDLLEHRVVPNLLLPIREAIASSGSA